MMLIQEALKQHWENVRGEAATPSVQREELGGGWCQAGWGGGGGDTVHAQLSSAHTYTDLGQENGSSLNLTLLAIIFLP